LKKAIAYRRDKKPEQPISALADKSGIMSYCSMNNLNVMDDVYEEGDARAVLSPTSPIAAMLDRVRSLGAQVLIVETLSHLSDEIAAQEIIIEAARHLGADVVSVREPKFNDESRRAPIRQALTLLNASNKRLYAQKLREGRKRARTKNGRCEGRKPYCYSKDPEEAMRERAVIARMRKLRNQGMSDNKIAMAFNTEGLRPRKGQRWWGKTVSLILRGSQALRLPS
jgi:DNA invertase Pin-like site-specific DNA recombinase